MPLSLTQINQFIKEFAWLHNDYYMDHLPYEGIDYPTLSHAWVASKTTNESIRRKISVATFQAIEVISANLVLREDWHGPTVLKDLLEIKFGLKPVGKPDERMTNLKRLAATGHARIIWGNRSHDNHYGVCLCKSCEGLSAKNMLGSAIEATRLRVRERIAFMNHPNPFCKCGKNATRYLLWSQFWQPVLTASCDNCLPDIVKKLYVSASENGDGNVMLYPLDYQEAEHINLPSPPPDETKTATKVDTQTFDDWGDECGCWYPTKTTTSSEPDRKWESMIWKCGDTAALKSAKK